MRRRRGRASRVQRSRAPSRQRAVQAGCELRVEEEDGVECLLLK
jgi:hypothetical protein